MDTLFGSNELRYVNGNLMKENSNNLLDQYFTNKDLAKELFIKTIQMISKYEQNIDDYSWLEPSVGEGCFFDLLPENKRIGVDFESKGKGSIKCRVQGLNLIHSERLPKDSFYIPTTQKTVYVKCVFQIWSKKHKPEKEEFSWYNNKNKEPFGDILKVATVSLAKNRECGKRWIYDEKADFYISSTFYDKVFIVYDFLEVKYKSGVAVVFTTENQQLKSKIIEIFENSEWKNYASLATNSCYHIGKSNIFQVLQDNATVLNSQNDL